MQEHVVPENPTVRVIQDGGAHNRHNVGILRHYRSPLRHIKTIDDIVEQPVPLYYVHRSEYLTLMHHLLCTEVEGAIERKIVQDPYLYAVAERAYNRLYGLLIFQWPLLSEIHTDQEDRGCSQSLTCFISLCYALELMMICDPVKEDAFSPTCVDAYPVILENCMALYGYGWDVEERPCPIGTWSQGQVYFAWERMALEWTWMRGVFGPDPETEEFYSPPAGRAQLRAYRRKLLQRTAIIMNHRGNADDEGDSIIDMLATPVDGEPCGHYSQTNPLSVEVRWRQEVLEYFISTEATLVAHADYIDPLTIHDDGLAMNARWALMEATNVPNDISWEQYVKAFEALIFKEGDETTNEMFYTNVSEYMRSRLIPQGWQVKGYFECKQVRPSDNYEMEAYMYPSLLSDHLSMKIKKKPFRWFVSTNTLGTREASILFTMQNIITSKQSLFQWITEVSVLDTQVWRIVMLAPSTTHAPLEDGHHKIAVWDDDTFDVWDVMDELIIGPRHPYSGRLSEPGAHRKMEHRARSIGDEEDSGDDEERADEQANTSNVDTLDGLFDTNENYNVDDELDDDIDDENFVESEERKAARLKRYVQCKWKVPMSERSDTDMPFIMRWGNSYMVYCKQRIYTMPGGVVEACAFWTLLVLMAGQGVYQRGNCTKLDIAFLYKTLEDVIALAKKPKTTTKNNNNGKQAHQRNRSIVFLESRPT